MDVIKSDTGYAKSSVAWRDSAVKATECALYLCTNGVHSTGQRRRLSGRSHRLLG